jgi:hypothetical protein
LNGGSADALCIEKPTPISDKIRQIQTFFIENLRVSKSNKIRSYQLAAGMPAIKWPHGPAGITVGTGKRQNKLSKILIRLGVKRWSQFRVWQSSSRLAPQVKHPFAISAPNEACRQASPE